MALGACQSGKGSFANWVQLAFNSKVSETQASVEKQSLGLREGELDNQHAWLREGSFDRRH